MLIVGQLSDAVPFFSELINMTLKSSFRGKMVKCFLTLVDTFSDNRFKLKAGF